MLKRLLFVGLFCASSFTCFGSEEPPPGAESPDAAYKALFSSAWCSRTVLNKEFGLEIPSNASTDDIKTLLRQKKEVVLEAFADDEKRGRMCRAIEYRRAKKAAADKERHRKRARVLGEIGETHSDGPNKELREVVRSLQAPLNKLNYNTERVADESALLRGQLDMFFGVLASGCSERSGAPGETDMIERGDFSPK
jgi:hypothetical protein